jgi:4-amino-4-deoxy-L-arabinose transferase-like glycosyltransferase
VALTIGLGYVLLAGTFAVLTPAWENNDEPDHVRYTEHVLEHGTPPRIAVSNGVESHQPPLYYYALAGWQRLLGIARFTPELRPPPGPPGTRLDGVWEWSHTYTPTQHQAAVDDHLLRLLSIPAGLLTVLAAVATGWLLSERATFAAALGTTVALWPKFVVVTSAVTNSALTIALCASAVPAFLMWRRSERVRWAALAGTLLGAAALTEETALPVAGLMLLLLAGYAVRDRDWRAPAAAFGCFAAVCVWWYVRDAVIYGDPLASSASRNYLSSISGLVRHPAGLSLSVLWDSIKKAAHSTWYDGGANQLQLPHALDITVWVVAVSALLAGSLSSLRGKLVLATAAIGSLITWLVIASDTTQAEGRYLLVGIIPWAGLLVAGAVKLASALKLARYRELALWLWPAIFAGVDGYVLATWLVPFGRI